MLLSELAVRTEARLDGDGHVAVERVASLESAGTGAIAFLSNPKYRSQLDVTRATAVIVAPDMAAHTPLPKLVSANPYATYAKVAAILHPPRSLDPGVHPTAVVGAGARIATSAAIGACAVIGAGATIAERASIGPLCAIGEGATIGDDALLYPRVTVYPGCVIGPRTVIHSGAVIGADGFGMAEDGGRWLKIPQVGRVTIGADVEIGANTTIDRGAIDDTVIEDDVKLDNQIQIGHNCRIGAHTAIAGCTGIAGSVRIGRNCKIGGAAMIAGHITIADGTAISGGATIYKSIGEAGVYTGTFPTLPYGEWRHVAAHVRRLRQLFDRVRSLEHKAADDGGTGDPVPGAAEIKR